MLNQPYTISLPTKIRLTTVVGVSSIPSFIPTSPSPTYKSTRRNPQSSKLVYFFLRRGGIIQKNTTPVQAPTQTENKQKTEKQQAQ
jgi:hypothetical protein